jgi:hypothetical protein
MAPLPPDGFIAHYISGVLYPAGWAGVLQVLVSALIAVSWVLYVRTRSSNRPVSANDEP